MGKKKHPQGRKPNNKKSTPWQRAKWRKEYQKKKKAFIDRRENMQKKIV